MGPEILEIQPRELEFIVEVKKQSTCSVKLVNNTDQYVAFKVKTTSPKKYCVRPNTGIIQPMSTCDFTVTMQAQKVAPPDLQCKDKFLIQSTVVPYGTAAEAVTTGMFARDNGKYIQENKLKVVLVSPPNSPILQPISGSLKQEFDVSTFRDKVQNRVETRSLPQKVAKDSEELKPAQDVEELKQTKDVNLKITKDLEELELGKDLSKFKFAKYLEELKPIEDSEELKPIKEVEELKPNKEMEALKPIKEVEELKPAKELDDLKPAKEVEELKPTKEAETFKPNIEMEDWKSTKEANLKSTKEVEGLKATNDVKEVILTKGVEESKLAKDVELLKSNLKVLESKLNEAEVTIAKLREERIISTEERQTLQQQLAMLRRGDGVKRVQAGFPFLFVCMVALIGVALGYLLRRQG